MTQKGVFAIDGLTFCAGLFWQPLSGATNAERSGEIKSLALELGFDMYIERTLSHSVGLIKASRDVKFGVLSAAAIVSKTIEEESGARDFIFASKIEGGRYLYVAQRDGVILSDGDQLFSSEDAVRTRMLDDLSLGDWTCIIAPDIWGIHGSSEGDFEKIIPRRKGGKIKLHRWWRLIPLDRGHFVKAYMGKAIIGGILIGVAAGGYAFHTKTKREKALAEAAALAAVQKDKDGKVLPPEHPWKKSPHASSMLHACMKSLESVHLFPGNWDIKTINCTNGMMTVSWRPSLNGWIEHLRAIEPSAVISTDGTIASISIPLPPLESGFDEPVQASNDRLIAMYSASQKYGVKLSASPVTASATTLPGQSSPVPAKDWGEVGWKAEGVALPEVVLSALDGDGFRMNSISATWGSGKFIWTMEGTQYVKP